MNSILLSLIALGFLVAAVVASKKETVPEIIRSHGYPCEDHYVQTEDGYILSIHRIPHGKKMVQKGWWRRMQRPPVLMQHGLLASSSSWVLNTPDKAPAYIMADAGYDVWLPNVRGNYYSKNHTRLSVNSKEFWQFSWDEMAYFDFPAFVDYILHKTGHKQLFYIGHSMGTTIFFSGMYFRPEYNQKIKAMFALGPVATVSYIRSYVTLLSYVQNRIRWIMELIGDYEFMPKESRMMQLIRMYCNFWKLNSLLCENVLFLFTGFDSSQFNSTWMPKVLDELMAGTSIYTALHYSQEYSAGKYQMYDYGTCQNKKIYGSPTPPEYNVSKVTAPVNLFWGLNDYLADSEDVQYLVKNLPNLAYAKPVPYDNFNHLDFLWAIDSYKLVYEPVLKLMHKYEVTQ